MPAHFSRSLNYFTSDCYAHALIPIKRYKLPMRNWCDAVLMVRRPDLFLNSFRNYFNLPLCGEHVKCYRGTSIYIDVFSGRCRLCQLNTHTQLNDEENVTIC